MILLEDGASQVEHLALPRHTSGCATSSAPRSSGWFGPRAQKIMTMKRGGGNDAALAEDRGHLRVHGFGSGFRDWTANLTRFSGRLAVIKSATINSAARSDSD